MHANGRDNSYKHSNRYRVIGVQGLGEARSAQGIT